MQIINTVSSRFHVAIVEAQSKRSEGHTILFRKFTTASIKARRRRSCRQGDGEFALERLGGRCCNLMSHPAFCDLQWLQDWLFAGTQPLQILGCESDHKLSRTNA